MTVLRNLALTAILAILLAGCHRRPSSTASAEAHPANSAETAVPDKAGASSGAVSRNLPDSVFSCTAIPDSIFAFMQGRSYKDGCTIPRDSLRYIRCLHKDASGTTHTGEMVVNVKIADDMVEILRGLYDGGYPIESMKLVDNWDADDRLSMEANNSSCFNFRRLYGTSKVSRHGLGMAVDINPLYNPSCKTLPDGSLDVDPDAGRQYADRNVDSPYILRRGDLCWQLFKEHGFRWGGDWRSRKDWQHFEK